MGSRRGLFFCCGSFGFHLSAIGPGFSCYLVKAPGSGRPTLFLRHPNPDDTMAPRIDNLPAEELKMALSVHPDELLEEEAVAVENFIRRIGGRENAMAAVKLLEHIEWGDRR
jgi:hypothetical protein